ncbi:MAG: HAMP domain-containing sensor histidine kinase [Dictyoglomus turgidum]|uniref:HAMP domain-containing sensor histidine kinase n=1 Tax=Dictyoglomus turgidum TaxID=513050 RepID=UPI003C778CD7
MKIAWKITLIYTGILIFLISILSFLFYIQTENVLMDENKKDLYRTFMGLGVGRGFMMGRMMGGRISSFYISEKENIIQDPFNLGLVEKEGLYQSPDGSYILVVKRNNYFIGKDITSTMTALDRLRETCISIAILGVVPSLLIGYFLSQRILFPIRRIIRDARLIDIKNPGKRVELPSAKDELWELANTLNLLFDRIEKAYKREEEFSSDISHELKTPLTSILGYIRMLKRWGKEDKRVLDESLDILENATLDMINMVDTLLKISRVPEEIEKEDINVKEFLAEILEKYKNIYPDFDFRIYVEGDPMVKTSKKVIEIILGILIDNGVKNSLDKKEIYIGYKEGKFFVRDFGKGIPGEEIPKIFERFYKLDKSRSSKGYGLGLSLAKKLAESIGSDIIVESKEGEGSIFYIKV